MRLRLLVHSYKSSSQRALAEKLSEILGYKVFRVKRRKDFRLYFKAPDPLNKLEQYKKFTEANLNHPPWTTDYPVAQSWFYREDGTRKDTAKVFVRNLLRSSGGKGIQVVHTPEELPENFKVATKYIPKKHEYRIHVFDGKVIHIQQKRKRRGSDTNPLVRNLENGYVYCHYDIIQPKQEALDLAINAVKAVGYLYGAVDIIYNEKQDKYYALEVNSCPGLEGITLDKYVDNILNYMTRT